MSFLFSVIIIPDCHLTAFILDTVGALIKNTLFKKKKKTTTQLSFCLSSLWLPPDQFAYFKKKLTQAGFQRDVGLMCPLIVSAIFYLPVLWQDHLPSVICGQGRIKWHGVVPAGCAVPSELPWAENWPVAR